jgi:hypothetical protein
VKKMTMPVIAMLLAAAGQTPSFAYTPVGRVWTYRSEDSHYLTCIVDCYSYDSGGKEKVEDHREWRCVNGITEAHCWGSCSKYKVVKGPCTDEQK